MILRRTRYEIIEDILAEARMGKPKTVIMGRCNLTAAQINTYTEALVEAGLLYEEENPDYRSYKKDAHGGTIKAIYTTTEAGWHCLNALEKSRAELKDVEEFLNLSNQP